MSILSAGTQLRVLHPPPDRVAGSDNANSLVMRCDAGGNSVILPGDLEEPGIGPLINQPRLLLADEPTGALDHRSAAALGDLLVQLNAEEKVALVVVTHALDLARRMQRTLELQDGQLTQEDATQ